MKGQYVNLCYGRLTRNRSVGLSPFKGSHFVHEQDMLPSLLSTCWFHELIRALLTQAKLVFSIIELDYILKDNK